MRTSIKRALFPALVAVALVGPRAWAGPGSDAELLAAAKATRASEIEPGLPATPVEAWLVALVGSHSSRSWSLNDCGEQTGAPEVDSARDLPICGELTARLAVNQSVSLVFLVGTRQRGVVESRGLYSAVVVSGDRTQSFRTLSGLAKHLRESVRQTRRRAAHQGNGADGPGRFYEGTRTDTVRFLVNDAVRIKSGPHAMRVAAVISIESLDLEPTFLVEPATLLVEPATPPHADLHVTQANLELLE